MRRTTAIAAFLLLGGLVPSVLPAQEIDEALYGALTWTNVGPDRGGRSTGGAGSDARPLEFYFGATGGGLWKTTDGGENWRAVTDGQITSSSVGAVQVCESNPDVVYIGTGEVQLRGNVMQGDGVYRSTDAGATWEHLGLEETQNVSRIRIHPDNCDVAWVAALGKHSMDNPERGVFKTTDGGQSWRKVLFKSDKAGAVDLTMDPANPNIMYASIWEAFRKSWGMSSGGPGSGLWKSTDAGETWTDITRAPGLPQEGPLGKIGVALSPANPDRVWTILEHAEGGVYRSDDGGANWEKLNEDRSLRQRAFYYTRIYADPLDENSVYALNTAFFKSTDGGETFERASNPPHGDQHDLWIAPTDPDRMINTNDGGGNVSFDGGESWTEQDFSTAQFYRVTTTEHEPYHICGAQQDNSTACVMPRGWNHLLGGAAAGSYLYPVGGGESGYIASNPDDPDIFYAGSYGGAFTRLDRRTGLSRSINVWPDNPMGWSAEDLTERAQWTFPIMFDRHDSGILYTGTQKLWKTLNEGQTWIEMSGDLTRADPTTLGASGGPITLDQTGVETYGTVFAIAPSYHDGNVIWVGSDDGYVHVTRNGRADSPTWTNVTPSDAPDFVRINTIEASPHTPGKAYVAGIRYLVDDDRSPYVWKTEDYGQSWTKITGGIPDNDFVRSVREDPVRPGMLFAGSETTVYVSWDDGANWTPLTKNLPNTQVSDLVVEDHDLVIGTHGRSFWVMYDIDPLRQLNPQMADEQLIVFEPRPVTMGFDNQATVYYYLDQDVEEITFEVMDGSGEVIETTTRNRDEAEPDEAGGGRGGRGGRGGGGGRGGRGGAAAGAGAQALDQGQHAYRWGMRYPGFTEFEGRIFWAAGNQGPRAAPGRYSVRITADGITETQNFTIEMNPRVVAAGVTEADLQRQFDLAIQVRDRVSEANESVVSIRDLKGEIGDRLEQTNDSEIEELGSVVTERLAEVEGEIYQVQNQSNQDPLNFPIKINNKLAALLGQVAGSQSPPTDAQYTVFEDLGGQLDVELEQMRLILIQDMTRLNELLREAGLDPIDFERLIT